MNLTSEEKKMLNGEEGNAVQKSMEILTALGNIFSARKLIDVSSVQVAGVSYHNLGDAGLEYLSELAKDGKVRVKTTLNPAGMDLKDWKKLGIPEDFAGKQLKVIDAFAKMGIDITVTCTPYLAGNLPSKGKHIAWSESSAVCFANSVIGAYTNREGGPSALASALTGKTPEYGMHLDENRQAQVKVNVEADVKTIADFGALGHSIGSKTEKKEIPYITGIEKANTDQLKNFCASIATYGGLALFHMEGITPNKTGMPEKTITITQKDIDDSYAYLNEKTEIDFVSVGCPHASIEEMRKIASLLEGKKVMVEFWISTSGFVKELAEKEGLAVKIEKSGAKIACDTCMAVAPLKGRFKSLATNSAKACYYGRGNNGLKTRFGSMEQCVNAAITGKWRNTS